MNPLNEKPKIDAIQKEYENYNLQGKKKFKGEEAKVIESIKKIHENIGWDEIDDRISTKRYKETLNRSVFAVSKNGEIIGYATARKNNDKEYYLSFIAVDKDKQSSGIGRNILLRVLEKVRKKGGEIVNLEFEEDPNLKKFYMSDKIPYHKELIENIGAFRSGKAKHEVIYKLTQPTNPN